MIPELGLYSLVLAGCLAFVASVAGLAAAGQPKFQQLVLSTTVGQCAFCALAFVALVWSFAVDDFSVAYVANHSNTLLPWYYKVSATWGGHEGSFLLWIAIMSGWMLALALRQQNYPAPLATRVLGVMALMNLGFICFALFTSNPFLRLIPMTPADGADLNPLLQDFGLIVHPPLLYVGYVGLAVPFAFAVADPANAMAAAFLIFSFVGTGSSFLAFAIIAQKRGISTEIKGKKGFFYLGGLTEGSETIIFLLVVAFQPDLFVPLAWAFGCLCWITTITRVRYAIESFSDL